MKSIIEIEYWNQILKSNIEIKYWNRILKSNIEIEYWNQILKSNIEIENNLHCINIYNDDYAKLFGKDGNAYAAAGN